MGKPELDAALERLHAELEQSQNVDDASRQLLLDLQTDIRKVLEKPSAASRASVTQRLNVALGRMEETHPEITLAIQQVLDHLAQV